MGETNNHLLSDKVSTWCRNPDLLACRPTCHESATVDLSDTRAKLHYMLCLGKYTKPCRVCAVRDIIIIIVYCYCFFSASIHMGDSDVAEAE